MTDSVQYVQLEWQYGVGALINDINRPYPL
jgi:hypothetical protein